MYPTFADKANKRAQRFVALFALSHPKLRGDSHFFARRKSAADNACLAKRDFRFRDRKNIHS
jgi:hypothetical protein